MVNFISSHRLYNFLYSSYNLSMYDKCFGVLNFFLFPDPPMYNVTSCFWPIVNTGTERPVRSCRQGRSASFHTRVGHHLGSVMTCDIRRDNFKFFFFFYSFPLIFDLILRPLFPPYIPPHPSLLRSFFHILRIMFFGVYNHSLAHFCVSHAPPPPTPLSSHTNPHPHTFFFSFSRPPLPGLPPPTVPHSEGG
jgi:hypothetical protein